MRKKQGIAITQLSQWFILDIFFNEWTYKNASEGERYRQEAVGARGYIWV